MDNQTEPPKGVTLGEMLNRIRAAYGLPITDRLTDADMEVIDVLSGMWTIGVRVGKKEAGGSTL
jgi:hypothetical protein